MKRNYLTKKDLLELIANVPDDAEIWLSMYWEKRDVLTNIDYDVHKNILELMCIVDD